MASSSRQQGNDHLKFTSNSPCFFKIILQDTITKGKLGIPRKFVKEHGHSMSSPAMVRVPSGEVWKVELTKRDDKIWFEKGCLEFASHYSVDTGHLLVFRYDGNSNFHVTIFDRSTTEIQYPQMSSSSQTQDQIINMSPARTKRQKPQPPSPRPHKTTRAVRVKKYENVEAIERARSTFQSENPFFLVVIHKSCVFRLTIPARFVREHLMKEQCSMTITLCNSNGKTWIVTYKQKHFRKQILSYIEMGWGTFVQDNSINVGDVCVFELINSIEMSFKVHIYKGQHANCHQPLTSSHVYHSVKRAPPSNASPEKPESSCLRPHKRSRSTYSTIETEFNAQSCATASPSCPKTFTDLRKARGFQVAGAAKSENPFFSVVLKKSYVNYDRLIIPVKFARKYLKKMQIKVILLVSNGRSWPVNYYQHHIEGPKPYVTFGKGWCRFAEDNNLEAGDVCRFELSQGAETYMNVTVTRKPAVEDVNLGSSSGDEREKQGELHKR